MNEAKEREVAVIESSGQEEVLVQEISSIEQAAMDISITDQQSYSEAAEFLRKIKGVTKKAKEYWEPLISSAYQTHKALNERKKQMTGPLDKAESIVKKKISDYQMEEQRKRREEEERLRRLAQEEMERKLAEAAEAEKKGDQEAVEYAMAEAEVLDNLAVNATAFRPEPKAEGISTYKCWVIKDIDLKQLPDEIAGIVIRPADEKAILGLIKASKGQISIPGVTFVEDVRISARAS